MFDAGIISLPAFSAYSVSSVFSDLTSTPQEPCASAGCARIGVDVVLERDEGGGGGWAGGSDGGTGAAQAHGCGAAGRRGERRDGPAGDDYFAISSSDLDHVVEVGRVDLRRAGFARARHEDVVADLAEASPDLPSCRRRTSRRRSSPACRGRSWPSASTNDDGADVRQLAEQAVALRPCRDRRRSGSARFHLSGRVLALCPWRARARWSGRCA